MAIDYLSGFANSHHSEAITGSLPEGMNSPQQVAHGLYAEKFSGTAFTAPRAENFRSWFYRIRPSVVHNVFTPLDDGLVRTGPNSESITTPNQLRWDPFPVADTPTDFVAGLTTLAVNGDARGQCGIGIHLYLANSSMLERFFYNSDGELMLVPQTGRVQAHTECGVLLAAPGEILVIPRGMKFRIELPDGPSRGYVLENYGAMLRLPERGPIGSDGLANERDFLYPVAAFEEREGDFELVTKLSGHLFCAKIQHSPLDVVGWHGNLAPYKYNLRRFNTIGSISYDHPDPSIFTVLTSPSGDAGVANVDFAIFPPRWLVMEDTFRPPWYHRNIMSEFMGLIYGDYDAKIGGGFVPGGASLHNCMAAHGPDADAFEKASAQDTHKATKIDDTMAFMFESRYLIEPTLFAMQAPQLQGNYIDCWQGLRKNYNSDSPA